jgi:hypothetical protein
MKKTLTKMLLITILCGVPLLFLGPIIWPPAPEVQPTQAQLPYLIVLSAIEALTAGFGIAFIAYGWPLIRKAAGKKRILAGTMYVAISWLLVSWWPHDNMHIHNAMNIDGLIVIEYLFHVTLMIAAVVLTYGYFSLLSEKAVTPETKKAKAECTIGQPDCTPAVVRP